MLPVIPQRWKWIMHHKHLKNNFMLLSTYDWEHILNHYVYFTVGYLQPWSLRLTFNLLKFTAALEVDQWMWLSRLWGRDWTWGWGWIWFILRPFGKVEKMVESRNSINKALDWLLIPDLRPPDVTEFIKPISHLFIFVRCSNVTTNCKQLAVHVCRNCAKNKGNYVKGE